MRGAMLMLLLAVAGLQAVETDDGHYWNWGFGCYSGGTELDTARYDWSLVLFGNVSASEETVARCNRVLALNPQHKFVVRVWPLFGGSQKVTLMRYTFEEDARERLLRETRRQVRLLVDGLDRPQNLVGSTFLEELPGHFTTCFMRHWKPGDEEWPEGLAPYRERIAAVLGVPAAAVDLGSDRFRLWWGEQYAAALADIHRAMKDAGEGRTVIYWQATGFSNLSHSDWQPGQPVPPRLVPVTYEQILLPGVCDGIFGYPNRADVWEKQTMAIVRRFHCPFFSQVSMPGGMRLCRFPDMLELARVRDPGNLGLFVYPGRGRETGFVWNRLSYFDQTTWWSSDDRLRRAAWDAGVGIDLVDRHFPPRVQVQHDFTDAAAPRLGLLVTNVREPSWFGNDPAQAALTEVTAFLDDGKVSVDLGSLGAREAVFRSLPVAARRVRVTAKSARGAILGSEVLLDDPRGTIPSFEQRAIPADGYTWIEPLVDRPETAAAVEILGCGRWLRQPELHCGDQVVRFDGDILREERLVVGPGRRARLHARNLFDSRDAWFGRDHEDGFTSYSAGYGVAVARWVPLRSGGRYRLTLTGKAEDGANSLAVFYLHGAVGDPKEPEPVTRDGSIFANRFAAEERTCEWEFDVPADWLPGTAQAMLRFYRYGNKGTIHYGRVEMWPVDGPPRAGTDVSDQLVGELPPLRPPFSRWQWFDTSDPPHGPKLYLRFLPPEELPDE